MCLVVVIVFPLSSLLLLSFSLLCLIVVVIFPLSYLSLLSLSFLSLVVVFLSPLSCCCLFLLSLVVVFLCPLLLLLLYFLYPLSCHCLSSLLFCCLLSFLSPLSVVFVVSVVLDNNWFCKGKLWWLWLRLLVNITTVCWRNPFAWSKIRKKPVLT